MTVVVFAETDEGIVKKGSHEAVSFGRNLADSTGRQCVVAVNHGISEGELNKLSNSGAQKIVSMSGSNLDAFSAEGYTNALAAVCDHVDASDVVISATYNGKSLAPRAAVKLNASLATGVTGLDQASASELVVKKSCFSNKAYTYVRLTGAKRVLSLIPNSFEITSFDGSAEVNQLDVDTGSIRTTITNTDKAKGKVPLTEAEIVVSGGRGLKGPENWGMIEELADLLGAATACSKPVSDMDWRPHEEHVGQTGTTIKPNLYIAVGISGAIQHLAGVGSSKVICVINTDPEAPFFKAADYGIVGDAFDVVPKLINRVKELQAG